MDDITTLKSENERLNKIIAVLLDQIAILKQFPAIDRSDGGLPRNDISAVRPNDANILSDVSAVNANSGITLNNLTADSPVGGNIINKNSSVNFKNGKSEFNKSADRSDNGNIANNSASGKVVPTIIEITDGTGSRMIYLIKKHFHVRVRYNTLRAIGKELLLMHNNGFASPDQLRPLTKLSHSGFSKHIIMLRRRGLIRKESWQKFILTDASKKILNETFGV